MHDDELGQIRVRRISADPRDHIMEKSGHARGRYIKHGGGVLSCLRSVIARRLLSFTDPPGDRRELGILS